MWFRVERLVVVLALSVLGMTGCMTTVTPDAQVDGASEKVTLTGSRIKREVTDRPVNSDSAQPMFVIDGDDIRSSNAATVGEALQRSGRTF